MSAGQRSFRGDQTDPAVMGPAFATASFRAPARLELVAAGVRCTSAAAASQVQWPGISAIEESEVGVYLFVAPEQAWIVPLSAFADRTAMAAFAQRARDYRASALQPNDETRPSQDGPPRP
ncbi:YcxB family protein [Alsobacter sp. SYSU M60028]|uniref:YcxB family protein n=1 Tax=Alsobacter ponti TaxID=2962936 RepID=A0ABT1LHX2_9HYPH|nr:YcxB family protein [Alsobacter ponti]MCP8941107.1 YcxB family protein [Alsobacter ponti]